MTNPYDIANIFNNYFASVAEITKKSIKYSNKHFSDYLAKESGSTISLQLTDNEEITPYPLSTLIKLVVHIVYLIEYYIFWKIKFQSSWQI